MAFINDLLKDTKYAARQLRRTPGLALAVTLCLGLGIGANTAIFTAIDALMLRMLPVKDPQSLVMLTWSAPGFPHRFVSDILGGGPVSDDGRAEGIRAFSYATFKEFRDHARAFSSAFAVAGNDQQVNTETNGAAHSATMQGVSGSYFDALGVSAKLGRVLSASDDQDSQPSVAVISYRFWQDQLAQDSMIIGQTITVNGSPITIVGVVPPEFSGLAPGTLVDLWVPLSVYMAQPAFSPNGRSQVGVGPPTAIPYWRQPTTWWLKVFGRVNPGVTAVQANAELQVLFDENLRNSISAERTQAPTPRLNLVSLKYGIDGLRKQYSTALFLLMGVVTLVLLIACGNVAALLLARATARQKEIAVRLSLGASRSRLIRQLVTESVLLALIGGAAGLLFAVWGDSVLVNLLSSGQSPLNVELHLNGYVLAFTAGISILTGILFGSLPALRVTQVELAGAVKQAGSIIASRDHRFRSGKVVVAGQFALCLVLVTSSGLLLRTLRNLRAIDAGFETRQLLLFTVRPGLNGYKDNKLTAYYDDLKRRIESMPGVRSVSLSTRSPLGQGQGSSGVVIPGYTTTDHDIDMNRHQVGADYFETLGIPITMGRGIRKQDGRNAPKIVVVNERLVRDVFHGDNPIGHHVRLGGATGPDYEIAGVARDVKYNRLQDDVPPTIYYPYLQFLSIPPLMVFEIRGSVDVSSLINPIQREAALLDRTVPVTDFKTETQLIEHTFVIERAFADLSAALGVLALVLAGIGLYGTISYAVSRQTKEVGIRMALGASPATILAVILRQIFTILASGLAAGILLTFMATPLLSSLLFGLAAHDAATIGASVFVIAGVMVLAGYLPARRAANIDPNRALRYE
jgi:predicted permease